MIGTLIGFTLLATLVMKGKPQAGLPLLCSGAILGYLVSSLLLFGRLVGLGF
jgi:presenilin-like A22 family membrane protease